ncbi:phosphatidate cytidylyltransferase [Bdellovibrio sp. HCB337]|uniref:phosphatidate cytidylyltransferase n=1 Tax=Bdellovibrio sp. HCB337 TaxID=3394358 RepID=UPI0039A684C1
MTDGFFTIDPGAQKILLIVLSILVFFTVLFYTWKQFKRFALLDEMITRTHSWWAIFVLYIVFFCIHPMLGYFGLAALGFATLKEFFDKFPESKLPQRVRFLAYIFVLVQFALASANQLVPVIGLIPIVYLTLVTIWVLLFEKPEAVMTAVPISLWGLLLCVFGLSHLSLLLAMPKIPDYVGTTSSLFLYYLFLTQFNDVLQFCWGTLLGKHKIAPQISPKKTWEGFLGAAVTTTVLAYLLRDITPFSVTQSLVVGLVLAVTGYFGDLNISAIKRNLSLKDMGNVIPGHGGLLDRIDSITFSSIVYFYLILYWFYK